MDEDYSGYNLYRIDWEEKVAEDTWSPAFAYVPSKEDIDLSNWGDGAETRNAIARLASDVEEEAYQCGFEDGFDVSTVQHRLAEMKKPLPVETHGCGCSRG